MARGSKKSYTSKQKRQAEHIEDSAKKRGRSTKTAERIASAPGSLDEALDALEMDHEYLLNGDVFTADVIHYWIKYKRDNEVDAIRVRPHPYEFCMYFDI